MTKEIDPTPQADDDEEAAMLERADHFSEKLYDLLADAVEGGLGSDGATLAVAFLIGRLMVEAEQAGDCYETIRKHFDGLVDQAVEAIRETEMDEAIIEAADARRRGEKPH